MNKLTFSMWLTIACCVGFIFGMALGIGITFDKFIDSADTLLDVHLNSDAIALIQSFPEIMARLSNEDKATLGLLNETLTKSMCVKKGSC